MNYSIFAVLVFALMGGADVQGANVPGGNIGNGNFIGDYNAKIKDILEDMITLVRLSASSESCPYERKKVKTHLERYNDDTVTSFLTNTGYNKVICDKGSNKFKEKLTKCQANKANQANQAK